MKKYPPVVIVDKQDRVVGSAMLKEAWAKGLHYRVVGIAVVDEDGRILLQRRAQRMEIDPGTWDMSAGGHVDEGQTYESAAVLELKEELGISGLKPEDSQRIFMDYDGKGYFLKLFTLVAPKDFEFTPQADEVSDAKWFTREEFDELIHEHPEQCAEFLREIYARVPAVFRRAQVVPSATIR